MHTIEIPMPDGGVAEAFVARPVADSGGEHPGVLFFMDAIGLRPRIAEMAQRIADWGYVVLAPNVFYREGGARRARAAGRPDAARRARGLLRAGDAAGSRASPLTRPRRDIPAYLETLRALPGVATGPVGTTGYCMGARLALRTAELDRDVAAVGGFHGGGLVTDAPDSPHLGLSRAAPSSSSATPTTTGRWDRRRSSTLGETLREAG